MSAKCEIIVNVLSVIYWNEHHVQLLWELLINAIRKLHLMDMIVSLWFCNINKKKWHMCIILRKYRSNLKFSGFICNKIAGRK